MITAELPHYEPLPIQVAGWARHNPGKLAIIGDRGDLTYAELGKHMSGIAGGLLVNAVKPGDRVVIAVSHKPDFVGCTLAAMAVGAYAVPTARYEEDLEAVIRNVEPRVIIADSGQCDHLQAVFPACTCVTVDEISLDSRTPLYDPDPEQIALFIHTSGTTSGLRRGTMLSHRSLCGTASYMNNQMGVDGDIRELIIPPLQHGFGMGRCRAVLHAGGTMVLQDGIFSPASALTALDVHKCNAFSSASSGVALLLENYSEDLAEIGDRIRWLEMGTLPLDRQYMTRLLSIMPNARIFFTYGMTEAIRSTILEINHDKGKLDTVGRSVQGTEVRIVDDDGKPVNAGTNGKIHVRGVNMASGYWNAPEAWQEKLCQGWVDSGDLGYLDEDGYLHFIGRQDDMINVGGLKVSPVEIEEALKPLLKSIPFAVARVPDPDRIQGYVPALFIEGDSGPDIETVRNSLRDHLAEFKIPRMILHIEELPRTTATRKVRRSELSSHALKQLQQEEVSRLPARISESLEHQRRLWPALIGRRTLSYGSLFRRIVPDNSSVSMHTGRELLGDLPHLLACLIQGRSLLLDPDPFSQADNEAGNNQHPVVDSVAIQWLDDGHQHLAHYRDIEIAADWFGKSFPLDRNSVVQIDTRDTDPELLLSVAVAVITSGGTLHVPEHVELKSAAGMLGAIHRHRVTHLLIGNRFIERALTAENYWNNCLHESDLEWIVWAGPQVDRKLFLEFSSRFGITPQHVYKTQKQWHTAADERLFSEMDERAIWNALRSVAAEIFSVEGDILTPSSATGDVPGWDSLAFVRLVAASEERFGIRLRPRDIMSITTLGDMERLIERRMR
jgi:long-chain acyl-CoA synthetase